MPAKAKFGDNVGLRWLLLAFVGFSWLFLLAKANESQGEAKKSQGG